MFSSGTGVMGNVGQADYAAANAFLDRFAHRRNDLVDLKQRCGRTLSIDWPLWKEGGMRVDDITASVMKQTTGMIAMDSDTGIGAFYQSLQTGQAQVLVMDGVLSTMRKNLASQQEKVPAWAEHLKPKISEKTDIDYKQLHKLSLQKVKALFEETTKLPVSKIDENEVLESYGIDSVMITRLNQKLEKVFGDISKTLFFEYENLALLTDYFVQEHTSTCLRWTGLDKEIESQPEQVAEIEKLTSVLPVLPSLKSQRTYISTSNIVPVDREIEPIAIIGISGIYPEAETLEQYWNNLKAGKDSITEIPADRWSLDGFYHSDRDEAITQVKSYSKWGGFVERFADFDPLFFNISPREVMSTDPQERLFLQVAWNALEDAGYTRSILKDRYQQRLGVFAGITKAGFNLYGPELWGKDNRLFPHTSFSSVANRLSYFLNARGPSMPIDTMCSSSLTAIHEACEHIRRGDCDMALAGGVNLYLHPSSYVGLCSQQMLSQDGKCKSFGAEGNGFVPGEGVGVVLLKPLSAAIQSKDVIHAVIRATNINHGGKTNGYTIPNPGAQAELIRTALDKAGINARDISYIEAHGTGTELGDPIEITGLSQAFSEDTQESGFCKIGSVKSNIGHLEAAAGIAGLTKIILQMKHRQIAPSLHSNTLNTNIKFDKTPFIVNQTLSPWTGAQGKGTAGPLLAGISSFGAGGANAHVILENYVEDDEAINPNAELNKPVAILLSARTKSQLEQRVRDLVECIRSRSLSLNSIAYTLQVGREAMEERLGFMVSSIEELAGKLEHYLSGAHDTEIFYIGKVKANKDALLEFKENDNWQDVVDEWIASKDLLALLSMWVKGLMLDWDKLYGDVKPKKVNLPTYPFDKKKYWILDAKNKVVVHETGDTVERTENEPTSIPSITKPSLVAAVDNSVVTRGHVEKPKGIGLSQVDEVAVTGDQVSVAARKTTRVSLSNLNEDALVEEKGPLTALPVVRQHNHEHGVVSLQITADKENLLSPAVTQALLQAIDEVAKNTQVKVLIITGSAPEFMTGGRAQMNEVIKHKLHEKLAAFPYPVIAAMKGNAIGAGFFMGSLCDFMIGSQESQYYYTYPQGGLFPTEQEDALFAERFGAVQSTELLYSAGTPKGAELAVKGWGCQFVPGAQVEACAHELAQVLAGMPQISLRELKQHLSRKTRECVQQLDVVESRAMVQKTEPVQDVTSPSNLLTVETGEQGVLSVKVLPYGAAQDIASLIEALEALFSQLQETAQYRAIVLSSSDPDFLPIEEASYDSVVPRIQKLLLHSKIPVIAALEFNASDAAWLLSLCCDACIYSDSGLYGYASERKAHNDVVALLSLRLGQHLAKDILFTGTQYSGRELRGRQPTLASVPAEQVLANALELAASWSRSNSPAFLNSKHRIRTSLQALTHPPMDNVQENEDSAYLPDTPTRIPLNSQVIEATVYPTGVLVVKMVDREARNLFSEAIAEGLAEVFQHIEQTPDYKVIVLTGYDSYFASGGTKEGLLAIQNGVLKYSDAPVYEFPIHCKIPVISAMQGHGIGAGWTLGMFSDFVYLSKESVYSTRFMSYGFTPGAGSTLLFPHQFGMELGREFLMTANEYKGNDIYNRGVLMPVQPRKQVYESAMELAHQIARLPRATLVALKQHFTQAVRSQLEETYALELAMHDKTFVNNSDALSRILQKFHQDTEVTSVAKKNEISPSLRTEQF
ncbi:polyketide synthase [Serratia proteamaculans]